MAVPGLPSVKIASRKRMPFSVDWTAFFFGARKRPGQLFICAAMLDDTN